MLLVGNNFKSSRENSHPVRHVGIRCSFANFVRHGFQELTLGDELRFYLPGQLPLHKCEIDNVVNAFVDGGLRFFIV